MTHPASYAREQLRLGAYWLLTFRALRRPLARVGRALMNTAQLRYRNDPLRNGERRIQREVLVIAQGEPAIVVVDCGANVGDWSLSLIRLAVTSGMSDRLKLIAIEPASTSFTKLERSLQHAWDGDHELIRAAASDSSGCSTLSIYGETFGTNSLEPASETEAIPLRTEVVATLTLDQLIAQRRISTVHLLKIDTEGHDLAVLRGAHGLLAAGQVWVVQFEYNHRWIPSRQFLRDVFDLINGLPYQIGFVTPRGVAWTPSWEPRLEDWYETNYVLAKTSISHLLRSA